MHANRWVVPAAPSFARMGDVAAAGSMLRHVDNPVMLGFHVAVVVRRSVDVMQPRIRSRTRSGIPRFSRVLYTAGSNNRIESLSWLHTMPPSVRQALLLVLPVAAVQQSREQIARAVRAAKRCRLIGVMVPSKLRRCRSRLPH